MPELITAAYARVNRSLRPAWDFLVGICAALLIERFLGVDIELWILAALGLFFFLMGARWEKLPNAGGYRLRKMAPLVLDLLKAKDGVEGGSGGMSHFSLANELRTELQKLKINHPDLHITHRTGDAVDEKYLEFVKTQLFLERLRQCCLDGDVKGARDVMRRLNGDSA